MRKSWRWMVVMVAQWERLECHWTVHVTVLTPPQALSELLAMQCWYFLQRRQAFGAELRESRARRTLTKDLLVPPGKILSFAEASMPQLVFTTSLDIHHSVICKMHSAKVLPQGTWNSNARREMQETNAWQHLAFRKELSGNRVPTFHRTVSTQEWSRGMCAILTLEFGG